MEALTGRARHFTHKALDGVSFSVSPGEAFGVIGANGAGKSTLLKIISGVLDPDEGHVHTSGRVAGLLELGTGFDPEVSGRANIALNARLHGLSEAQIAAITADVIDFAELGPFIESPVRTYSSGMAMRLGFAIAYHTQPQAFLVDEALSVGDARFQQKCMRLVKRFKANGGALLFVSHDLHAVSQICDRVLVLNEGRVELIAPPDEAIKTYYRLIAPPIAQRGRDDDPRDYGEYRVRIAEVGWKSEGSSLLFITRPGERAPLSPQIQSGDSVSIQCRIDSDVDFEASVGILIRDRFGQDIFGLNTAMAEKAVPCNAGGRSQVDWTIRMDLSPGAYTLTVAVHSDTTHLENCQHWWDDALTFEVSGFARQKFSGLCHLPTQISVPSEPQESST
jgi:lipopolysaccharide transport system ATP-binding protein